MEKRRPAFFPGTVRHPIWVWLGELRLFSFPSPQRSCLRRLRLTPSVELSGRMGQRSKAPLCRSLLVVASSLRVALVHGWASFLSCFQNHLRVFLVWGLG